MAPLLVTNLVNIRYLTGLSMTAGTMLLTPKRRYLFVDNRYIEKAKKEARRGITVLDDTEATELVRKLKSVRYEEDDLSAGKLRRWKKLFRGTKLMPSSGVIEDMRRQKKKHEIEAIEKACRITDRILAKVPKMLKVGVTESDVSWKIEVLAHEYSAEGMGFESIVAFGPHTSRPHHRPTKRRLRKGDIVQIDMGVTVEGYSSDCSRMFFTGPLTEEQKKVYTLLLNIVKETTKMTKVGAYNTAIDKYARDRIDQAGYEGCFLHSLGHGVGLELHETPNFSCKTKKKTELRAREVVTTEPGIYFAGKWGMRIEDTMVVTRSGGKRLTKCSY